jgi:hypothetical protein
MKTYGEWRYSSTILDVDTDGSEWTASRPCRFTSGERVPDTHWIGGWVGPRSGLNAVERRKIVHFRESNPRHPARNPSLYWLMYPTPWRREIIQHLAAGLERHHNKGHSGIAESVYWLRRGLTDRRNRVRIPEGAWNVPPPPIKLVAGVSSYDKTAGAASWRLTYVQCRWWECSEPCLHCHPTFTSLILN